MPFRLKIETQKGLFFNEEVDEAYFPSVMGPLGVLPGHTRIISKMKPAGILKVVKDGKSQYFAIFGGILNFEHDEGLLLAPLIENGSSIDLARAQAARDRAQERLEKKAEDLDEKRAKAALLRALVRIECKMFSDGGGKA
ncbi:MAG: ATP synthase F1 subunit epsilon [Candidatus Enteromonas sp.]|jgi:F-type H+-transporting ATPase subunit epsilon|nr:ATP synthase F1 subunit epsilon [Bacilli bacterium]MEE3299207.1 ATP synthase F1 subunit epsilon [Candidatus Enteromonas sp.]MBQ2052331.1 ATP synthase F1 subunit epsilon [Bacilli bacterium]MCR5092244.1 ATP synthase F1 subunit epsilon [Bacilli bacterium]MEE3401522.1 ATP synthase F1 subunit epsilon [Candidatus Enteromonas sp.]